MRTYFYNPAPIVLAILAVGLVSINCSAEEPVARQVIELRTYILKDEAAVAAFDKYAAEALVPALNRLGIQPVGAFKLAAEQPPAAAGSPVVEGPTAPKVMLLLPGKDSQTVLSSNDRVARDAVYVQAAADYLKTPSDQPQLVRITSELLNSFKVWPQVKVPPQLTAGKPRLFELRIYESPTEQLGHLKVEMFNSGEVPIFLACKIQPVFMGQAVIGSVMPNLTYMTVYDDSTELAAAWKRFQENADWKVLREVAKYKGTVSKIHKSNWVPTKYSQL